jgi:diguanylate cyclase (GGDEF)-like protein
MHAYLIVLAGGTMGRTYKLADPVVVLGRSMEAHIRLDNDGVSRAHAKMTRRQNGRTTIEDLGSLNGTYVNGVRIESHELADGDRIQLGASTMVKFSYQDMVEEQYQRQLYDSATRDDLTELHNRRYFNEQLSKDFSHAIRHQRCLSVLMLDLDYFKSVNDTHGHAAGDTVLHTVGATIQGAVRNEDLACRVGGEEIAIVLRDTTASDAFVLAERLRALVRDTKVYHAGKELSVTVSIGIASLDPKRHRDPSGLVEEADKNLYEAKRAGRDRVHPPASAA